MALNSGFPRIEASNNTFSDWLNRTNEICDIVRGDDTVNGTAAVTANSSGSDTYGNARILGEFAANTLIAVDELRGGDLFDGNSANLSITSNAIFTSTANLVTIEKYLQVDTDSLFVGNVEAQSTIQFTKGASTLEFAGANQTFIWNASNTHATIRTDATGSLVLNADIAANATNESRIDLKVDSVNVASFVEGGNVVFYSTDGVDEKLIWDAANERLGINTAPVTDVALGISGNTQTTNLVVTSETTSGNVVVNDELRGSNTLTVTTNALFTAAQVVINNDLFVEGDAQVTSNLTVNTDSTFVGDIKVESNSLLVGDVEAQSTIQFTGNDSTLQFAGANQTFIWDSTESTIRTNADGSLIIDADKTANGVSTTQLDLRVDDKNSIRIEDDHVAFYDQAGTNKKLYWDAANVVLGINTDTPDSSVELDIAGTTKTTDLVVDNTVLANVITIEHSLKGSANLDISSNVTFQANALAQANLTVQGTLSVGVANLDYTLVPDNYDDLIPNQVSGRLLGNTTNRWEGYFTDLDVSADIDVGGSVTVTDTITTDILVVTNTASLPSSISFSGVTDFEDINVTGVASFANLQVQSLTTNTAGLIGTGGVVTSTSPTKIDEFDKTVSRGFKYIIHGENADSTSAYAIEINCSHNGTTVFYTRFGEVSNNFDAVIVPQINGSNVELIATCSSASVSNTHSFNMVRIETR